MEAANFLHTGGIREIRRTCIKGGFKMARIDDLEKRIEVLEERLDLLTGKPRGPITMHEARLANERGDKATVQRYLKQFEKQGASDKEPTKA